MSRGIFVFVLMFVWICNITSYAQPDYLYSDGNCIYNGGINRFDDTRYKNLEETAELEEILIDKGYVMINSNVPNFPKQISEEEFDILMEDEYWFSRYVDNVTIDTYYKGRYRTYVYYESLKCLIKAIEEDDYNGKIIYKDEIDYSTVVINEQEFYWNDLAYTESDEINDKIPDRYETGFLCIKSPVAVKIKLISSYDRRYYTFYLTPGNDFYVELKKGRYFIVSINDKEVSFYGEESIAYNNCINVGYDEEGLGYTKEDAFLLDLSEYCEKYKLVNYDVSSKSDLSLDQNQNLASFTDAESTIVYRTEEKKEKAKNITVVIVFIVIMALAVTVIIEVKFKGCDGNENEEDKKND